MPKERKIITVTAAGRSTKRFNVSVTATLDEICDRVEAEFELEENSVILYIDSKLKKTLDEDSYRNMRADAAIYLPDPKEVRADAEDSSDEDELEVPAAKANGKDPVQRDGALRGNDMPKIFFLEPDERREKLLAKKPPKLDPPADKDGCLGGYEVCFFGPLRDVGLLAMLCEDMTAYPSEKRINTWADDHEIRHLTTVSPYHVVASPYAPPFMHFPTLRLPDPDTDPVAAEPIEVTVALLDEEQLRRIEFASPHGARWARLWVNLVSPDDSLDQPDATSSLGTACALVFSAEGSKNPLEPEQPIQRMRLAVTPAWSFDDFSRTAKEAFTEDFKERPEEDEPKRKGKKAAVKKSVKSSAKSGQKRLKGADSSGDDEPANAPRKRRRKKLDWQRP